VVGKFVEFFGPGVDELTIADRATIANMAPEYGATCGFFPVDGETLRYLTMSSRPAATIALVEAYAKAQGMWRDAAAPDPVFSDTVDIDIGAVEPSIAGPKRPQDKVALSAAPEAFKAALADMVGGDAAVASQGNGADHELDHGDVVIAAITSCTNTSNPSVMVAAGLVARKARMRGLSVKPWVKTSLAPGSRVVTDYLAAAGLDRDLDALGFNLVGYGCTTCIGNTGPLPPEAGKAVADRDLVVCAVLSGNRNFESRISPQVRANYLASPPLVVAYALAGSLTVDLTREPLGEDSSGNPVYLRDIWPTNREIQDTVGEAVTPEMFATRYADITTGDEDWQAMETGGGLTYGWSAESTYVQHPPYFEGMGHEPPGFADITGARLLVMLGDSITTDHISPAGAIAEAGPAGQYLIDRGVAPGEFSSYGARRGNHEVMMRGGFANVRLRNEIAPGTEGGWTRHVPSGEQMTIYDAALRYKAEGVPLVVVGGRQFGGGSSRDWAAKAPNLLGIKAVIVESFERIHRANLIGMGVLPLEFAEGVTRETLALDGSETFDLTGIAAGITPRMTVSCRIGRADGSADEIELACRIDTVDEVEYYRHGGILHYVLRQIAGAA
jgi:aconitate hydratase